MRLPKPGQLKVDLRPVVNGIRRSIDKAMRSTAYTAWRRHRPVDLEHRPVARAAFYAGWDAHRNLTDTKEH